VEGGENLEKKEGVSGRYRRYLEEGFGRFDRVYINF